MMAAAWKEGPPKRVPCDPGLLREPTTAKPPSPATTQSHGCRPVTPERRGVDAVTHLPDPLVMRPGRWSAPKVAFLSWTRHNGLSSSITGGTSDMKARGQALAAIRQAILDGFQSSPNDIELAVDQAAIGKTWTTITYGIKGLDACVNAVIQYAAQQGRLTALLSTLAEDYNPSLGPRLNQLALDVKPIADQAVTLGVGPEDFESKVLADVEFQEAGIWIERLRETRRAVCRVEPQPESQGKHGYGTGFLVAPDIVMTCNHVAESFWNDSEAAKRVVLRFDYEKNPDGSVGVGERYQLAEDWRIHAAVRPDYALLRVRPAQASDSNRRPIPLTRVGVSADRPLLILQHPDGDPLKLLFGEIAAVDLDQIRYSINTEGGSSGSPCLTPDLQAAAIHYASGNCAYAMRSVLSDIRKAATRDDLMSSQRQALHGLSGSEPGPTESVAVAKSEMARSAAPTNKQITKSYNEALTLWREKLAFLLKEEVTATGEHKFALRKRIEECHTNIRELGGHAGAARVDDVPPDFEDRVRSLAPPHFDRYLFELEKRYSTLKQDLPPETTPLGPRANALFRILDGAEGPGRVEAYAVYRLTFFEA